MQAVIMAGGAGERLRPLTNDIPKPMVKIIDTPVLELIVARLKDFGIYDIGITLNYKAHIIKDYFGDGRKFGVKIRYFTEEKPLGTAGGVKQTAEFLDDNFLVLSGDALCEVDYNELYSVHFDKKRAVTMVVKEVEKPFGFGVVQVKDGIVSKFIEKPEHTDEKLVNTGIYACKRQLLDYIPDGFYDFGRDLFPKIEGEIAAYETKDYWSDIGTLKSYYEANIRAVEGYLQS